MSLGNINFRAEVESHVESHLIRPTPAHTNTYDNSMKNGLPMIAVSPVQGKFTSLLASMSGASNILEIGTLGGYSSLWFAESIKGKGKVTSIEVDSHHREVAIQNLKFAGINCPDEVDIILGKGLDVLPVLEMEIRDGKRSPFDFIFIDADWENQWNYFDYAVKLSKGKGSVIYVDNAVRNMIETGIVGKSQEVESTDLVAKVGNDSRVEAVVMQTVGAKSYDGFLMAVVK
ncbi:O-methyltransferase [Penicillium macrosclerotiorum]|uniref:O-methyltransferase n=1 Tax=Penicillium macrosclerotiorum TaxID=303699 RepID=UPI0025484143|nr:O-methyltransferase [Penicillium macrosclerotiorum]KAJ5679057.1 O-methyltransferase [Penicillium macrosclerotiorum]